MVKFFTIQGKKQSIANIWLSLLWQFLPEQKLDSIFRDERVCSVSSTLCTFRLALSDSEFSVLQSTCSDSNLCFFHLPTAFFWTSDYLLSQGPSAFKAHNCHPNSIVSCCSLQSRCYFVALPSCDSLAFQLPMSLLLFIFSAEVKYTNCSVNNGGCEHFCRDDPANQCRSCSCASGYQLMNDHTMCKPVVEFPCGRVKTDYIEAKAGFNIRLIEGRAGRRGESPWQVRRREFFITDFSSSSWTALPA